jgi:hypothetical protein
LCYSFLNHFLSFLAHIYTHYAESNTSDGLGVKRTMFDFMKMIGQIIKFLIDEKGNGIKSVKDCNFKMINAWYRGRTGNDFLPLGTFNKYWSVYINTFEDTRRKLADIQELEPFTTFQELFPKHLHITPDIMLQEYFDACEYSVDNNEEIDLRLQPEAQKAVVSISTIYPGVFRYTVTQIVVF